MTRDVIEVILDQYSKDAIANALLKLDADTQMEFLAKLTEGYGRHELPIPLGTKLKELIKDKHDFDDDINSMVVTKAIRHKDVVTVYFVRCKNETQNLNAIELTVDEWKSTYLK